MGPLYPPESRAWEEPPRPTAPEVAEVSLKDLARIGAMHQELQLAHVELGQQYAEQSQRLLEKDRELADAQNRLAESQAAQHQLRLQLLEAKGRVLELEEALRRAVR